MATTALRPLTQEEERLLRWILENGSVEAKSYLPQIEGILAEPSCTCGCPSISLVVSDAAPTVASTTDRIVGDLTGQTVEGISVGVLLFQDDGKLTELEVYPYDNEAPFTLPTLESLDVFVPAKPFAQ